MDVLLGQAELLERHTGSDLDLSSDDVNPSDLLCDGVLDLDTGVDFDKVVPVLLVYQKLACPGVPVAYSSGDL